MVAAACWASPAAADETDPRPTISVTGSAVATVPADAGRNVRRTAYTRALRRALRDARAKAQLVARGTDAALGPVETVFEQSDPLALDCRPQRPRSAQRPASPARDARCTVTASVGVIYALRPAS
jgi:uncharacterized protein YggE